MILKGSQRGGGADLAVHLMNSFENEHIEIAEIHGAVAPDLAGAFAEFEAVALGTRAREYLYSLSINPPEPMSRAHYAQAIDRIERGLGLAGQPRAVVFHLKNGREHCHVVWSRIDAEKMRAVHLSHDKSRLMDIAVALCREYGFPLSPGLENWEKRQRDNKQHLQSSLAERAQEKATGVSPEKRRAAITACYEAADTAQAFAAALADKGYILARGDRRAFIVVDEFGAAHSLTRYLKGHKARDVNAKLAAIAASLPRAEEAKELALARAKARADLLNEKARADALEKRRAAAEEKMAPLWSARRLEAVQAEQTLLTRQQEERLSLHAAQAAERRGVLFRLRSGVADLIARMPALRSVLGPVSTLAHLDPRTRHRAQSEALSRRHAREKAEVERLKRLHARLEARERGSIERAIRRDQRLAEDAQRGVSRLEAEKRQAAIRGSQDFFDAAKDDGLWKKREFAEGEITKAFNDAAEFNEGAGRSGEDEEERKPGWADPPETGWSKPGPESRKVKGYHRDEE